jgi:hypothetical protein
MIRITGSKFHRVWKCPASAVLPQVDEGERNEPARNRGKAIHAYLERVAVVGQDVAMMECPDEDLRVLLRALDLDELPVNLATEVAYRIDLDSGVVRELGRNIDRAYEDIAGPPGKYEIDLTLDIVGVDLPGSTHFSGFVADYKSGHTKYPPPDMFGQTLLGALAVAQRERVGRVVVQLIHIHDDGDRHKVTRDVNEWDLGQFAEEGKAAIDLAYHYEAELEAGRGVKVNEGSHCQYCPAYKNCPAKVALVRSIPAEMTALGVNVVQQDGTIAKLDLRRSEITVARAAMQWMAVERLETVLKAIKTEICGLASFEEIPLPDGRVIGRCQTAKRELDGKIAGDVIEKRYGRAARAEVVLEKVSLERVSHAVIKRLEKGEKAQTRKGDGVVDQVMAEIDRLGGVGMRTTEEIKPYTPRRKKLK